VCSKWAQGCGKEVVCKLAPTVCTEEFCKHRACTGIEKCNFQHARVLLCRPSCLLACSSCYLLHNTTHPSLSKYLHCCLLLAVQRIVYVDNPDLGYIKGNQEIPAGAAFELEVEVLSANAGTSSSSAS